MKFPSNIFQNKVISPHNSKMGTCDMVSPTTERLINLRIKILGHHKQVDTLQMSR